MRNGTMIKYLNDRAVVRLTGSINQESVTGLIDAMEHARDECFYGRIEIAISSTGGEILAYERLFVCINALREDGIRIDTSASGVVASAAAFLLSMGTIRRASPECRLRYHLCRVEGEGTLTAADAGSTAAALTNLDDRFIARLAERGVEAAKDAEKGRANVDAFEPGDWKTVALFLTTRSKATGSMDEAELLDCFRKHLDRDGTDAEALAETYRTLFAIDRYISPVLARELFLIDGVGRSCESRRRSRNGSIAVPEWKTLWPGGRVDMQYLRRHMLVLGETGSGKTASGVMPLVNGVLSPQSGLGCALIIDPKRELLPAIRERADDVRVIEPGGPGRPGAVLNLTAGASASLDEDLESGRFQEAARRILVRSADLATRTPVSVWAGLSRGDQRQAYWDHEGGSLASLAVSIALMVIAKRREIFAGADSPVSILTAAQSVQAALAEFGEAAGILPSRDELGIAVESALEKAQAGRAERSKERAESVREALDRALVESAAAIRESLRDNLGASRGDDLEAVWEGYLSDGRDRMVEQLGRSPRTESDRADPTLNSETWLAILNAVKRTDIHACEGEFRKRLRALDRNISLEPERFTVREAVDRILLCGFVARNDCEAGLSPNVMALAQRILDLFLTPVSGVNEESDSGNDDKVSFDVTRREKRDDFNLRASYLLQALKPLFGLEIEPVWQDVKRWEMLSRSEGREEVSAHYVSILAIAQQAFRDFAAPAPAWTLYFGIEPYWKRLAGERSLRIVDFAAAVDADEGLIVWVIQPKLGVERETIVAKAMKAGFFESVLGNEARAAGIKKPLVVYAADEFHRFVTAGDSHGEQSFLDTCRSFNASCALSSQSIASIEHALAGMGGDYVQNEAAVSVLLNNVGTKLFFRTTDEGTIGRIRTLCPTRPGRPAVVDVRPPSTLSPGECYAALPDGRFERRQLAPCYPGESGADREAKPPKGAGAIQRETADVIRLFEPGGEA